MTQKLNKLCTHTIEKTGVSVPPPPGCLFWRIFSTQRCKRREQNVGKMSTISFPNHFTTVAFLYAPRCRQKCPSGEGGAREPRCSWYRYMPRHIRTTASHSKQSMALIFATTTVSAADSGFHWPTRERGEKPQEKSWKNRAALTVRSTLTSPTTPANKRCKILKPKLSPLTHVPRRFDPDLLHR